MRNIPTFVSLDDNLKLPQQKWEVGSRVIREGAQKMLRGTAFSLLIASASATAQTGQAGVSAELNTAQLQEIVVTARKRAEGLQQIPVAVSALSGAILEQTNIQQIDQISRITPNVAMTPMPSFLGGNTAFIRGIGAQDPSLALDPAVATYIDGIYIGRNLASNFELVELERVEVLRGPQGSLFGRNTTGGAISMVTRSPAAEFGFQQKVGWAEHGEWSSRTTLDTGELGASGLAAIVSYLHRERDGYVDNPLASDDGDPGAINADAVWLKLSGDYGAFSVDYSFDYNRTEGVPGAFQIRYTTPTLASYYDNNTTGNMLVHTPGYRDEIALRPLMQEFDIDGHSLTLAYDFSDQVTLKSISGYRRYDASVSTAYAPSGIFGPVLGAATPQEVYTYQADDKSEYAKQFSQELQLIGDYDRLQYVVGLYYFNEEVEEVNNSSFTFVLAPTTALNLTSLSAYEIETESFAAFGQVSYTPAGFDDKLEVTLGARYTEDTKDAVQAAPIARTGKETFYDGSYQLTLSYQWTDDVMTYAKFNTGYRSGGFNVRATAVGQSFLFPSEEAEVIEAGIKSEFFNHRLRVNAAAFITDYDNLQTTIYTNTSSGSSTGFTNPAAADFKGFEIEVEALPTANLSVSASVGYVDPEYDTLMFPAPGTGTLTNYADSSRFPYVPEKTAHLGVQYSIPTDEYGDFLLRVDWSYMSKRWFHQNTLSNLNPFNELIASPSHDTVDFRFTWAELPIALGDNSTLEVSFYGQNLTDEHYPVGGIDFGALGFAGNIYNMPRRFGLDVKFTY